MEKRKNFWDVFIVFIGIALLLSPVLGLITCNAIACEQFGVFYTSNDFANKVGCGAVGAGSFVFIFILGIIISAIKAIKSKKWQEYVIKRNIEIERENSEREQMSAELVEAKEQLKNIEKNIFTKRNELKIYQQKTKIDQ